ncbi:hypothetical protein BJY16_007549 [Actinoplanes octamycinicus]|uniref:Uncharacterized protein n=1 Tax=Actinoplanes octamycinicus TaxID=135948 RepID=A0A7W7MBS0_9ACTN|nr:hypothetical protein [Actinoplanes octamycinicus]MBB4744090.1 hypothetical protein [Actinoplanes octamycinicus]GIE56953.1 hypothetical protein Aoc01nite_23550 [Actinoplanes octamycinicus]
MDHQRSGEAARQTAALLRLALQLRDVAADADRRDVVAKVDELMGLIAGESIAAGAGSEKAGSGVTEAVQRILNGLGF